jgi:hypothetical protein
MPGSTGKALQHQRSPDDRPLSLHRGRFRYDENQGSGEIDPLLHGIYLDLREQLRDLAALPLLLSIEHGLRCETWVNFSICS